MAYSITSIHERKIKQQIYTILNHCMKLKECKIIWGMEALNDITYVKNIISSVIPKGKTENP